MLSSGKLHAEDPYLETILIEELSEEPKIDGIIEKSIWNSIKEYSLQKSVGRHFLKQPTFVKMGYKGNHLFIILEVVEKDFKDLEQTSVALDSEKIFD